MVTLFINTDKFYLYQIYFNSVGEALELDKDIEVEKRLNTRGTIRGLRISPLAKIYPFFP